MLFNTRHRFTKQFEDIPQEDIARCPHIPHGESPETILARDDIPDTVKHVVRELPYSGQRKYTWIYVRPQHIDRTKPDTRSGNFWHIDADSVYRARPLSWDDFKVMAVSFGDISETEFLGEPLELDIQSHAPNSSDYVALSPYVNGKMWNCHYPKPCQVAEYTLYDFHRAGPMRRDGWRLIMVIFETDAEQPEVWA